MGWVLVGPHGACAVLVDGTKDVVAGHRPKGPRDAGDGAKRKLQAVRQQARGGEIRGRQGPIALLVGAPQRMRSSRLMNGRRVADHDAHPRPLRPVTEQLAHHGQAQPTPKGEGDSDERKAQTKLRQPRTSEIRAIRCTSGAAHLPCPDLAWPGLT